MAIALAGAVACVTGAGRGIGEATARALAQAGAKVVLGDIDEARVQQVAKEIGSDSRQTGCG